MRISAEVSSEITFQIPTKLSANFKPFFQKFDKDLDILGIRSYGISVPTLEDVFLRVTHEKGNSKSQSPDKQRENQVS